MAYDKLLLFMKERNTKPIVEEKQILDGIKIILDNGWVLQTEELLEFFNILGLREKVVGMTDLGDKNPFAAGSNRPSLTTVAKRFKNMDRSELNSYDGVQVENLKFLEFIYLLVMLFDIDVLEMQHYFGV